MKRLLFAVVLLALFASAAGQVAIFSGTSNVNFSSDSTGYPPIPVVSIWDNSDGDTARMVSDDSVEVIWPAPYRDSTGALVANDSSKVLIKYLVSGYDATYNPSGAVTWLLANGFEVMAPIAWGPSLIVRRVDSTIAAPTGSGGTGANTVTLVVYDSSNSAVVADAEVTVYAPDTSSLASGTGPQVSDAGGVVTFSLDDATYPVDVGISGKFMESAYQPVVVSGATTDSIWLYSPSFTVPGVDSCLVIIFTDSPNAQAKFKPNSTKFQSVSGVFLNTREQPVTGDGNGIVQLSLPRTDSTMQKTTWSIKVWSSDPGRPQILDLDEYKVPNQTQDTVFVGSR